jgi:hypothetical protein
MVDVELFVSAGAPRAAFRQESTSDDSESFWSVDADMLQRAGWVLNDDGWQGPLRVGVVPQPHPYGLGPMWGGSGAWRADFVVNGRTMSCAIDHEALSTHSRDECRPGPPLASASPWLWHIADEQTQVCGRSENPLEAATQVESLMRAAGADTFAPTSTKVADLD